MNFISASDECSHRNAQLIAKHISIPSYALWRDIDIENQTIEERISWWEKSEKTPGQQSILQSLRYMKEHSITSESLVENDQRYESNKHTNYHNHFEEKNKIPKNNSQIGENKEFHPKENNIVDEFCSKRFSNEFYCDI